MTNKNPTRTKIGIIKPLAVTQKVVPEDKPETGRLPDRLE
jgi:hypothetical protein